MIETGRLFIRKFLPSDADDLFEYLSLPETYRYEHGEPITSEAAITLAAERAALSYYFAVILKNHQKMIGHLYFDQRQPLELRTWELGFVFNPDFQRQGYGFEAASALVAYAFENVHPHRIMARCDQNNIASWKLLEKIGFVREGDFKKFAFLHLDATGQPIWIDAYEYSFLEHG